MHVFPQCDLSRRSLFSRGMNACQHKYSLYFGRQFLDIMISYFKTQIIYCRSTWQDLSFTGAIHLPLKFLKRNWKKEKHERLTPSPWVLPKTSLAYPLPPECAGSRWYSYCSLVGKVTGQLSQKRSNTTFTSFLLVINRKKTLAYNSSYIPLFYFD